MGVWIGEHICGVPPLLVQPLDRLLEHLVLEWYAWRVGFGGKGDDVGCIEFCHRSVHQTVVVALLLLFSLGFLGGFTVFALAVLIAPYSKKPLVSSRLPRISILYLPLKYSGSMS